jgi:peptidoglycan hydrolase-like protein with peptidoglycan-binding domain
MDADRNWYLLKYEDGADFGPVSLDQLRDWAEDAKVSPLDKVSNDNVSWVKAPMIPELGMDFLIEVSPDQYYGPTTLGAVKEFLEAGEIQSDSIITNCQDGTERKVADIPEINPAQKEDLPVRTSMRKSLQQRIRDLEEALLDERRARMAAEELLERLESRR